MFLACASARNETVYSFPTLQTNLNKDTLSVGELLQLKISFSDTSYFRFKEYDGSIRRITPPFMVDGKFVQNDEDAYIYTEKVEPTSETVSKYVLDYIAVGVVFPHPVEGEGDVTVTKLVSFTIENDE